MESSKEKEKDGLSPPPPSHERKGGVTRGEEEEEEEEKEKEEGESGPAKANHTTVGESQSREQERDKFEEKVEDHEENDLEVIEDSDEAVLVENQSVIAVNAPETLVTGVKIPITSSSGSDSEQTIVTNQNNVLKCVYHPEQNQCVPFQAKDGSSVYPNGPRVAYIISTNPDGPSFVTSNTLTRISSNWTSGNANNNRNVRSSSLAPVSGERANNLAANPAANMTAADQNQMAVVPVGRNRPERPHNDANRILAASKEQRRRERRERRARRYQQRASLYNDAYFQALYAGGGRIAGPIDAHEILHPAHMIAPPPPYSTLPGRGNNVRNVNANARNVNVPVISAGIRPSASNVRPQDVATSAAAAAAARVRGWRQTVLPTVITSQDIARTGFGRSPALFGDDDATGGGSGGGGANNPTANGAAYLRSALGVAAGGGSGKNCCGVHMTQTVSIRWFIVLIAFVGICCSIVGTVLGALKASGREHLTVSLLMIGVGIVLITVSGVAWRLTATDAPSCRAMLGLGGGYDDDYTHGGRFLSRPNGSGGFTGPFSAAAQGANAPGGGGRSQHPYAAMMYSDFHYRPPPPSYQASMQEYRLRLLLLDRAGRESGNGAAQGVPQHPNSSATTAAVTAAALSPPPQYRAQLRAALAHATAHSRPPSYHSQVSDQNQVIVPPTTSAATATATSQHQSNPQQHQSHNHRSQQQQQLSSQVDHQAIVHARIASDVAVAAAHNNNVVSISSGGGNNTLTRLNGSANVLETSLKSDADRPLSTSTPKKRSSNRESSMVTIISTESCRPSDNPGSVIVTISGAVDQQMPMSNSSSASTVSTAIESADVGSGKAASGRGNGAEVDILAHL